MKKIMSKIYSKHFIKFLRENNCYDEYLYNIKSENGSDGRERWSHPRDIVSFFHKYYAEPYRWILSSFEWSVTNEGYDFWSKINDTWCECYRFLNKKYLP